MAGVLTIHIDGASLGNPGPAGIGVVIWQNGALLAEISESIGRATNNQAEYHALLRALEEARKLAPERVEIRSDSQLLVRQMLGQYQVRDPRLRSLYEGALQACRGLRVRFVHVPREENRQADALASRAAQTGAAAPAPGEGQPEAPGRPGAQAGAAAPAPRESPGGAPAKPGAQVGSAAPAPPANPGEAPARPGAQAGAAPRSPERLGRVRPLPMGTPSEPEEERECVQMSAGGVVFKKEGGAIKVCLISKKGGSIWALPKGRVDQGETPEDTARREVLEETGHLAEVGEKIDQIEYHFYWKENRTLYHKVVYFYLMPLVQENARRRDQEADSVAWFTLGEAYRRLTYLNEKEVVRKAQRLLKIARV